MSRIDLDEAIAKLESGEVVALPSETVYGLAGRSDRLDTVQKIFQTKQRPSFDPLILHVASFEQVAALTSKVTEAHRELAKAFWPGPLTMIFEKAPSVLSQITAGLETVAIRSPEHRLFLQAIQAVGVALAAPSANQFSRTSPTEAEHVLAEFQDQVSVVDGGPCKRGLESTIVQVEQTGQHVTMSLLRPGVITPSSLRQTLENSGFSVEFRESTKMAPGRVAAHYRPRQTLILYDPKKWNADQLAAMSLEELNGKSDDASELSLDFSNPADFVLNHDPVLAARELYSQLRSFSASSHSVILCAWPFGKHPDGQWEAIFDRLSRASSFQVF